MPCSRVPELIERQKAGKLPLVQQIRLRAHLSVCKWCAAYERKVRQIDRFLTRKYSGKQKKETFEKREIQSFKDRLKREIAP